MAKENEKLVGGNEKCTRHTNERNLLDTQSRENLCAK